MICPHNCNNDKEILENIAFNLSKKKGILNKDSSDSNIRNLLLTNKGERVGQPEFGCGLLQILFEPMSDSLIDDIKATIEEITPSIGKDFPISNPSTITAPVKPSKTPNH